MECGFARIDNELLSKSEYGRTDILVRSFKSVVKSF